MPATLEERFTLLEKEVARLRAEIESNTVNLSTRVTGRTSADFLDTMIGIHADSPAARRLRHKHRQLCGTGRDGNPNHFVASAKVVEAR